MSGSDAFLNIPEDVLASKPATFSLIDAEHRFRDILTYGLIVPSKGMVAKAIHLRSQRMRIIDIQDEDVDDLYWLWQNNTMPPVERAIACIDTQTKGDLNGYEVVTISRYKIIYYDRKTDTI